MAEHNLKCSAVACVEGEGEKERRYQEILARARQWAAANTEACTPLDAEVEVAVCRAVHARMRGSADLQPVAPEEMAVMLRSRGHKLQPERVGMPRPHPYGRHRRGACYFVALAGQHDSLTNAFRHRAPHASPEWNNEVELWLDGGGSSLFALCSSAKAPGRPVEERHTFAAPRQRGYSWQDASSPNFRPELFIGVAVRRV